MNELPNEEQTNSADQHQEVELDDTPSVEVPPEGEKENPDQIPRRSGTVTMSRNPFEGKPREDQFPIFMVRATEEDIQKFKDNHPMDPKGELYMGLQGSSWLEAYERGMRLMTPEGAFNASLKREGSDWQQSVEHEGRTLFGGRPPIEPVQAGMKLTGKQAITIMQAKLGLGNLISWPCWSSGIWIHIEPPTDAELLNLDHQLAEEKIRLGRDTMGMVFSNQNIIINEILTDFILEHVVDANIVDWNREMLRDLIVATDFQSIVLAMASTIYPNGYTLMQPCTHDTAKCTHVSKEHINLLRMSWIDRSSLTSKQRKFMTEKSARHTIEQIKDYQSEGKLGEAKVIDIKGGLKIALMVPSLDFYLKDGHAWVDSIQEMVIKSIGSTADTRTKEQMIYKHSVLAAVRYYGHFIKHIIMDEAIIDDRATIDKTLDMISADPDIANKILSEIGNYIDEVTINLVAIPSWKCPNCQHPYTADESVHPYLIPQDANLLFFDLKDRKLLRVKIL